MPDTGEALKIWQAIRPMIDKEIAEQTESCVRAKKMIVKQATVQNEDGSVSLGVSEPYNDKVMIPSGDELSNVNPGSPVWVYWYFNNASTMHVALNGDGTHGSAVTDRLLEMLNKEIADREKADNELQSYIERTASHLRVEFADGLNSLRSYVELTSSALRLEFHDDLNGLRSYLEMTASHLRIEFYDDLNGLRSYLEMTASHLRAEFYDDMNSLRSYLELTASHLRAEFYDDMNSLRSYLELTASHLRAEFYDDVNSLRSYLELTASHLRTEFYDDLNSMRSYLELTASHLRTEFYDEMNSLRSYVEITASHLSAEFYDDINSLRSYVDIQAGKIDMNVAATDENSSILRQAGMYINDQGVLVYATDSQNNIGSKLAVMNNEISAKVGKSEVVITDDSITIGSQSISLAGYVTAENISTYFLAGDDATFGYLEASTLDVDSINVQGSISTDYINGHDPDAAIATLGPATSSGGQITIPYTTLGGSSGSVNFNIADTQFYIDGVAAAARSVSVANSDIVLDGEPYYSNKRYTVYVEATATATGNGTTYSDTGTAALVIDATEAFNAGAASVSSRTATSAGSVTLTSSDIGSSVSKTTTVTYDDSTSTPSVPITINASAVYSAGRNSVTIANSDIVRDGSDYYNSSTHNTTIYIEATASNGASGTQSFVVSGASAYAAGQASVSQRTATYVAAGTNLTPDSTGKYLSGTCQVYYDDGGSPTSGVPLEVNATAAYNAGQNSVTISNSDIVRDGEDYYSSTTHKTTIYVEATASNGEKGTQSFTTGTEAYIDGQNSVYVSGWSVDKSNLPTVTVTVTLSNGVVRSHSFNV